MCQNRKKAVLVGAAFLQLQIRNRRQVIYPVGLKTKSRQPWKIVEVGGRAVQDFIIDI